MWFKTQKSAHLWMATPIFYSPEGVKRLKPA